MYIYINATSSLSELLIDTHKRKKESLNHKRKAQKKKGTKIPMKTMKNDNKNLHINNGHKCKWTKCSTKGET